MNPREYQNLAGRTECDQEAASRRRALYDVGVGKRLPTLLATRLSHAVLGLAGEVGELAGALEKWLYYHQEFDVVNVKEELGDCLWYIALACNALGFDLNEVMEANIAKLRQRYPEKYTDAQAVEENRDRNAESDAMERVKQARLRNEAEHESFLREEEERIKRLREEQGSTLDAERNILDGNKMTAKKTDEDISGLDVVDVKIDREAERKRLEEFREELHR